ncbi:hypothetical protein ACEUZ9_000950 [Paracoccus litorisediminis]|uniref:hypothetical protein n=1 Tax=Paracoccus litorisediminis TaxID=2006130 RepID=UPI0037347806
MKRLLSSLKAGLFGEQEEAVEVNADAKHAIQADEKHRQKRFNAACRPLQQRSFGIFLGIGKFPKQTDVGMDTVVICSRRHGSRNGELKVLRNGQKILEIYFDGERRGAPKESITAFGVDAISSVEIAKDAIEKTFAKVGQRFDLGVMAAREAAHATTSGAPLIPISRREVEKVLMPLRVTAQRVRDNTDKLTSTIEVDAETRISISVFDITGGVDINVIHRNAPLASLDFSQYGMGYELDYHMRNDRKALDITANAIVKAYEMTMAPIEQSIDSWRAIDAPAAIEMERERDYFEP